MKIGLIGYSCNTGLGEINRQMNRYVGVTNRWVIKHPRKGGNTLGIKDWTVEEFVSASDCILFAETPLVTELPHLAKAKGKRLVCVPMQEWLPYGDRAGPYTNWTKLVDLFICPTLQCYNLFKDKLPCTYFPWPVDTSRFSFQQRRICKRFLFINGNGGWHGRKGIAVIEEVLRLWPQMPLIIRSQVAVHLPSEVFQYGNVKVLPEIEDNRYLYAEGDVLISPHSVDGLCLEVREAMSCGMPVITTDGEPWNELPALARIEASETSRNIGRPLVTWYNPKPSHLFEICQGLLGREIHDESNQVKEWAWSNSWDIDEKQKLFSHLIREGKAGDNAPNS